MLLFSVYQNNPKNMADIKLFSSAVYIKPRWVVARANFSATCPSGLKEIVWKIKIRLVRII